MRGTYRGDGEISEETLEEAEHPLTGTVWWLTLPEIHSQRHPFSNIDNFVVASAKLSQIKIVYNLNEELSLRPKKAEVLRGSFSHPSCTLLSSCSI